jgi:hypothetical protein
VREGLSCQLFWFLEDKFAKGVHPLKSSPRSQTHKVAVLRISLDYRSTMRSRSNRTMLLQLTLLGASAIMLCSAEKDTQLDQNDILRRKRVSIDSRGNTEAVSVTADNVALEDLWEQAASASQLELETKRLLENDSAFSMSMTIKPTPAPAPKPTKTSAPTISASPTIFGQTRQPTSTSAPSETPTVSCVQGITREEYLLEALTPITDESILLDPSTPQGMAFSYLNTENPCKSTTLDQRFGLATIYFATGGDSWTNSDGWLGDSQECDWFGVSCAENTNPMRVTTLSLGKRLYGMI